MWSSKPTKLMDSDTPIEQPWHRIRNIFYNNYRGIFGFLLGLTMFPPFEKNPKVALRNTWLMMIIYFVLQPVFPTVTALIPMFMFPITGVLASGPTCMCCFNENIALVVLCGMMILLWNNSGLDKRIAVHFLCSGDMCQFSGKRLVFKGATAAFIMSMFSNRLISTLNIFTMTTPIFTNMQSSSSRATDADFDKMRDIFNSAVHTSSVIGSLGILHSSFTVLCFKSIWCENAGKNQEYQDVFNYMQYSSFAIPVCLCMFFLNVAYHMLCVNWYIDNGTSTSSMAKLREGFMREKSKIKSFSLHEFYALFFSLAMLAVMLFRWSAWIEGWSSFRTNAISSNIPEIKDATVAAMFVIAMFVLPSDLEFLKYFFTMYDMPPKKPASAILWWKYVDNNINYAYMLLMGAGGALNAALKATGVDKDIATGMMPTFTQHGANPTLLIVVVASVVCAHIMTPVAACCVLLPFVLSAGADPTLNLPWPTMLYKAALGVGMGTSLSFMAQYRYTPAFYANTTGKSKRKNLAKYGFGSVIICGIVLWVALCFYAPVIFDPNGEGFQPLVVSTAPPDAAPAPGGGGGGGDAPPPPPPPPPAPAPDEGG